MGSSQLEFGNEVCGQQSPNIRHAYLRQLVRFVSSRFKGESIQILEIGSWVGASAITWAAEIRDVCQSRGRVHCVDPWEPYFNVSVDKGDHYEKMNSLAATGRAIDVFHSNIRAAGVSSLVSSHKGASCDVLPLFKDQCFHIIYIDGAHSFEFVNYDIQQAKRLVKPDGVIAGDDLELERANVDLRHHNTVVNTQKDFEVDPATRKSYHPGVTEAVANHFQSVFTRDGFWCVSNSESGYAPLNMERNPDLIPDHLPPDEGGPPQLVKVLRGYNIIYCRQQYYALHQELGAVDLGLPDSFLVNEYDPQKLLISKDLSALERKITRTGRSWTNLFGLTDGP